MNNKNDSVSQRYLHTPSQLAKSSLFYLQEIGTLTCDPGFTSQRDALDSFLFLFVPRGKGTLIYKDNTYKLSAGSVVWINCNHGYTYTSSTKKPLELSWIHCNSTVMKQLQGFFRQRQNNVIIRVKELQPFVAVYEEIEKLLREKKMGFEYSISLQLHNLVNAMTLFSQDTDGISNAASSISEKSSLIKEYIEAHFAEKITLDDLSREFCVSKYYMLRSFRNQYGMTIIQYLGACRIQQAKKLLRFSDMQIEAIAHACGFDDVSYFNRMFRSYEEMTAGQFRKQWRS